MIWLQIVKNGWTWAAIMTALLVWCVTKNKLDQLEWELERQKHVIAMEEAKAEALLKEKDLLEAHQQSLNDYINSTKVTNERQTQILSDLNTGVIRLRSRFQCQAGVSNTPTAPSSSDGTGPTGLLASDAEFFVRFAADADKRVNQLTACQALIKEYQNVLRP